MCARSTEHVEVRSVELFGYRAMLSTPEGPVFIFAPGDTLRLRVECAPSVALAACGRELSLPGFSKSIDRRERGGGVLLSHALELDGRTALEVAGRSFMLQGYRPAPRVEGAEALKARAADPATQPLDALDAMKELARLASRGGQPDEYRRIQEARAERALAAGLVTEASDAWSAAAYFAYQARDFAAVRALLDRAEALDRRSGFALGMVRSGLVRGYSAREQGNYREALRVLEEAASRAWLDGYDADLAWVQKALGPIYLELGLPERALEQLHRLEPHFRAQDERARLAFLVDLAWVELEAMARGSIPLAPERPSGRLEEALVLARKLNAREDEANILTNLLWADQLRGDRLRARARIREIDESQRFARLAADLIEGTIFLDEGNPRPALEIFSRVLERADGLSSYVWRALYGRARAAWALGDRAAAAKDFLAAQSALETLALQADLQTSRARFLDDAGALQRDAVRFFLETGAIEEAFLASERARTQVLLSLELQVRSERLSEADRTALGGARSKYLELRARLDQRAAQRKGVAASSLAGFDRETAALARSASSALAELYALLDRQAPILTGRLASVDALRRALPEDAELISFAESGSSTVAFALDRRGIRVETGVPLPASGSGSRGHLYLVAGAGYSVERIARELLPAVLRSRTATILPYAGALLARRSAANGAPLVVADPRSDLPHARAEGERVAGLLPGAVLLEGDAATERAVRERIAGAALFHFAGHGLLAPEDPWQSRLELAGGALTLEGLLIGAPAIQMVVLSGCETGRGARLSRRIALGLPEAFLLAGAESVLATTDRVRDEDAARFIARFYAEGGAQHPARAFRAAVLAEGGTSRFYLMGRGDEG